MLDILTKSIRSLTSRKLISLSVTCLAITGIALFGFIYATKLLLSSTEFASWQWLEAVLDFLGNSFAITIAWFLFPVITPIIASLFTERVAKIVTDQEYPNQMQTISPSIFSVLLSAIMFTGKMLLLNIACLPLYLIPMVNIVVYYVLNSYLLGREFFEMVSNNYFETAFTKRIRKKNRFPIMAIGLLIVFATTLPIINLFAPIIAITLMVHLFFYLHKNNKIQAVG